MKIVLEQRKYFFSLIAPFFILHYFLIIATFLFLRLFNLFTIISPTHNPINCQICEQMRLLFFSISSFLRTHGIDKNCESCNNEIIINICSNRLIEILLIVISIFLNFYFFKKKKHILFLWDFFLINISYFIYNFHFKKLFFFTLFSPNYF